MGCCAVAVVTVCANGSLANDEAGAAVVAQFRAANHRIVDRDLVHDDRAAIELLAEWIADLDTDVIVVTGVGDHALSVLLNCGRRVNGFGELARVAVFNAIGSAALHVRAEAVRTNEKLVVAVGGSVDATRVILDAVVLPQLNSVDPAAVVALVPNSRARRFTLDRSPSPVTRSPSPVTNSPSPVTNSPSPVTVAPSVPVARAEMTTDRLLVFGDLPTVSHSVMVMSPIAKKRRPIGAVLATVGVGVAAGLAFTISHAHAVAPSTPAQSEPEVVVKMPDSSAPVQKTPTPAVAPVKVAAKTTTKSTAKKASVTPPARTSQPQVASQLQATEAPSTKASSTKAPSTDAASTEASSTEEQAATVQAPQAPEMFDACTEQTCAATNYERECCTPYKNALAERPLVLDRTMIANAMTEIMPAVSECGAASRGTVKLSVRVNPDGTVSDVEIREAADETQGACVADAIRGAHFRATARGGAFTKAFTF